MVGPGVLDGMLGPTRQLDLQIYLCKLCLHRTGVLRDSPLLRANQCGILPQPRLAAPSVEYFILFSYGDPSQVVLQLLGKDFSLAIKWRDNIQRLCHSDHSLMRLGSDSAWAELIDKYQYCPLKSFLHSSKN